MFVKNVHHYSPFWQECARLGGPVTGCGTLLDGVKRVQKGVKEAKTVRNCRKPKVKQA